MKHLFCLFLITILIVLRVDGQVSCDEPQRYLDHLFEVEYLEFTEEVFATFDSDQLWNGGDTTANTICFDPRNYLSPQEDGSWDMSMIVVSPKASVDNCTERASVVFVHGGGYAYIAGNNTSTAAVASYVDLARRGYVVCAINHRKGWDIRKALNSLGIGPLLPGCQNCPCENSNNDCQPYSFMKTTYTMAQDVRAAHRKLLNEKLTYGIDEDLVFYMGASTGAVGVLHAAFGANNMPQYEDDDGVDLETHLGGIDAIGEAINNGSNFKIAGVNSVAGALKESEWIESSDNIPVMFNHTTLDEAVIYCQGSILQMNYVINFVNDKKHLVLAGPGRLYKDVKCLDDPNTKTKAWLRTHKGLYHNFCAPLGSSDPSDNCDELSTLEGVQDLNCEFMREVILGNEIINNHKITEAAHVSGPCNIVDSDNETPCSNYEPCIPMAIQDSERFQIKVYPNPSVAGSQLNLAAEAPIRSVQLFDLQGRKVLHQTSITVNIPERTDAGIYYLKIVFDEGYIVKKVMINNSED